MKSSNGILLSVLAIFELVTANPNALASGSISEIQKLFPADGAYSDKFGFSADMSGNTAVVSSYREVDSVPGDKDSGWAYVFGKNPTGSWQQLAKLSQSDSPLGNGFGTSVAISGNTILVGADGDEHAGQYAGAAYVFAKNDSGQWNQVAKLFANDAPNTSGFGVSVDIDGDRAIIGAERAAYVFNRTASGAWQQVAEIIGDTATSIFGETVSINGNTAVVGDAATPGHVYIFRESTLGSWNQIAKLAVNDSDGAFGESVAINENRVFVGGETGRAATGHRNADAYIFHEDQSGIWQNDFHYVVNASVDERADKSVAINGDVAIAGFPRDDLGYPSRYGLLDYGSAYIFKREGESWNLLAQVQPSQLLAPQFFGMAVAIDNGTALVAAYADMGAAPVSGAAYLYAIIPEPNPVLLVIVGVALALNGRLRVNSRAGR